MKEILDLTANDSTMQQLQEIARSAGDLPALPLINTDHDTHPARQFASLMAQGVAWRPL